MNSYRKARKVPLGYIAAERGKTDRSLLGRELAAGKASRGERGIAT